HCTNPHLQSFPTRRSSDLRISNPAQGAHFYSPVYPLLAQLLPEKYARLCYAKEYATNIVKGCQPNDPQNAASVLRLVRQGADVKDRKSTRLNSSHVSISYA